MSIMDLKLAQGLARIDHDCLFLVFLDLHKAYNTVDRYQPIQILGGYGAGPCMCRLLDTFWSHQQLVPRQNVYHGPAYPVIQGTTQGGLVSPTIFNVVVDNAVRIWLSVIVEYQRVYHDGLREAFRRCLGFFYTNYGMVGSRDPDWLQHSINMLVGLF